MRPSPLSRAFAWFAAALFAASLVFFGYSYVVLFGRAAAPGDWTRPALLNALFFTVFALHHSVLARTAVRDLVQRAVTPHLERALYTCAASVLFLAVCWLWQPVPGIAYRLTGFWWWLGVAIQATGVVAAYVGSSAIDPLDLAGIRQTMRAPHGAPAHVPLKTTGVYGLVRHPIYLGWLLVVFGAPTMTGTRLVFAIISTVYLAIAVPWEERGLLDAFGTEYRAYQQRVRWRIVPGIY
jgi:protein-S-isoprenylcysteine O-methyltransferase Ste14